MQENKEKSDLMKRVRKMSNDLRNKMFLGKDPDVVSINFFPEVWEEFFPGQRQMIKGVKLPDSAEAVMIVYHSEEKGVFAGHVHDSADENIFVIKGEVTLQEPTGETVIRRGENHIVKAGVAHSAKFAHDTIFTIVWTGEGSDFLRFKFFDNTTKAAAR